VDACPSFWLAYGVSGVMCHEKRGPLRSGGISDYTKNVNKISIVDFLASWE